MTQRALEQLFEAHEKSRLAELEFWSLAEQLTIEGVIMIDDVAMIYGCHPQTARKRLADLHYHPYRED